MKLLHNTKNGQIVTTYEKNTIVCRKDKKILLVFDPMLMYDFLKFHMNPKSKSPGIARRGKALALDRLPMWIEEAFKQRVKTPKD